MNAVGHALRAHRPTLHDAIVAFLRERSDGVSPEEVAERFLKLKAPDRTTAAAAITGILAPDRRCFTDNHGRWHASQAALAAPEVKALSELPFVAVFGLTDPGARRLMYLAQWETIPSLSCCGSAWLVDPRLFPHDEREILQSSVDPSFTPETADGLVYDIARAGGKRIPVFLSSHSRSLLASTCASRGEAFPDDTLLASELLKAAGTAVPRPLTLAAFEKAVLGAELPGASARKQGERFAAALGELFRILNNRGIESREQLDIRIREDKAPLFAGKEFTYDTLLALPPRPGVYAFKDGAGAHLYIGKANNLKRRLLSYFCDTDESPLKLGRLLKESRSLVVHECGSELESLIYEHRLIRKYAPPLNSKTDIHERKGTFRPIGDCIVLLPHAVPGSVMSLWFREKQKILLKSFPDAFAAESPLVAELRSFFFDPDLPAVVSDFPEQEIAVRWIKQHADSLASVPVSRMASAEEIYDALRIAWHDLRRRPETGHDGL
ncbi:MAG: nucleotide excision repair endonuclease [Chitinispirillaceae bacterium]